MRLSRVEAFKQLAVQQAFLGKGTREVIGGGFLFKFRVGVKAVGVHFEVIHHGMADSVGERGLFTIEDGMGEQVALKGMAQQILAHPMRIELILRIDAHHIAHEIKVAKGHARFQGMNGNAAVGAQHVIHVQLVHALFGFVLERARVRSA